MFDWFPLYPVLDATVRHGSDRLPYYYGLLLLYSWNIWKWEKQRIYGKRRDAKDNEQDNRLDTLEGNKPMEFIESPNYTKGRLFQNPSFIVIHSMAGNMDPSIKHFQDGRSEVSSHYLISHEGRVVQMVEESNTAWHAGVWMANLRSIGIEHEGGTFPDGHNEQLGLEGYRASAQLIANIHISRGWGEPSSKTLVPHSSLKATACPSGLDMGKLIQAAQDAYNGRPVLSMNDVTPPAQPTPQPNQVHYENERKTFDVNLNPSQNYSAEVRRVQEFLIAKGFLKPIASNEYGYYGKKTQAAIDWFQKANGIVASKQYYGLWYEKTRAAANKLM